MSAVQPPSVISTLSVIITDRVNSICNNYRWHCKLGVGICNLKKIMLTLSVITNINTDNKL